MGYKTAVMSDEKMENVWIMHREPFLEKEKLDSIVTMLDKYMDTSKLIYTPKDEKKLKIAVLGAGISGLASAYLLSKKHHVDLYEKENRLGGHARTTMVEEENKKFGVDTGFLVFNHETYPLLTKLFKELDVKIENSDMSFAFWDKKENIAYNGQSLGGMFVQKKNLFSPSHYKMISDIMKFNKKANEDLENNSKDLDKSLGEYLEEYSEYFKKRYLMPMGASIWSTPTQKMNEF